MAMVDLSIAGRTYQVACREGEEESLRSAARLVDAKSREALAGLGTLSEARQFLFASLMLADSLLDNRPEAAAGFVRQFPGLHSFVLNKWYFDELYDAIFVRPAMWLGRLFWKKGDEGTIDRFGPHGAAYAVGVGNKVTARLQSGYLYSYAFVMLLGLIGAASWAIWWAAK